MLALAESIVENEELFQDGNNPFEGAQLFILSGKPGLGKTHMIEAFINHVTEQMFETAERLIYFSRGGFPKNNLSPLQTLIRESQDSPILLIDDLYSEMTTTSSFDDYNKNDLAAFIQGAYVRENW